MGAAHRAEAHHLGQPPGPPRGGAARPQCALRPGVRLPQRDRRAHRRTAARHAGRHPGSRARAGRPAQHRLPDVVLHGVGRAPGHRGPLPDGRPAFEQHQAHPVRDDRVCGLRGCGRDGGDRRGRRGCAPAQPDLRLLHQRDLAARPQYRGAGQAAVHGRPRPALHIQPGRAARGQRPDHARGRGRAGQRGRAGRPGRRPAQARGRTDYPFGWNPGHARHAHDG